MLKTTDYIGDRSLSLNFEFRIRKDTHEQNTMFDLSWLSPIKTKNGLNKIWNIFLLTNFVNCHIVRSHVMCKLKINETKEISFLLYILREQNCRILFLYFCLSIVFIVRPMIIYSYCFFTSTLLTIIF
jgi:hypothetical protein